MRKLLLCLLCIPWLCAQAISQQVDSDDKTIYERAKAATVIVLSGSGAGRLETTSTGVILSKDGLILTALHAVKGAAEVQVRLANGDVFDQVQLLGSDERRDVAALKISAVALPFLSPGSTSALAQGDPVYAVTNAGGLAWSATAGILSAIRDASEVPGAGSGYRLLQFTAPVSPGSSGGALMNRKGEVVGIITSRSNAAAFAIPIENVLGLPDSGQAVRLGSGANLQLPLSTSADIPQSSAGIAGLDPKKLIKDTKTIYIESKTSFLTVDTLVRALTLDKNWPPLGLVLVQDPRVADVIIKLDRPLFTYVHTFVITDKRTSIVLGSGKDTAFDGTIASGPMAKDIIKIFASAKGLGK